MKVRSWREQRVSDHRFLVRAVPFALTSTAAVVQRPSAWFRRH